MALPGDGVTPGVVRVGDTVRRPVRQFTATVQAFLAHLHREGFHDAPRPMGYDEEGREVLSFVPGEVPRERLPAWATGTAVLRELARLIGRQHEAAGGWTVPSNAVWGRLPGGPGEMPPRCSTGPSWWRTWTTARATSCSATAPRWR